MRQLCMFVILSTAILKLEGYFFDQPTANVYKVPQRMVGLANATQVFHYRGNTTCVCRNACYAAGCNVWSVTMGTDGNSECRLSVGSPSTDELEFHPKATYYFRESEGCSVSSMMKENRTLIYPESMLKDVALGKQVFSSPAFPGPYEPQKANDGDDTTFYASDLAATNWWTVDLGTKMPIFHIKIYPRQDSWCYDRFHDVEVFIGDTLDTSGNFSSSKLLYYFNGPYTLDQGKILYTCNGVTGRYLSVRFRRPSVNYTDIASFIALSL